MVHPAAIAIEVSRSAAISLRTERATSFFFWRNHYPFILLAVSHLHPSQYLVRPCRLVVLPCLCLPMRGGIIREMQVFRTQLSRSGRSKTGPICGVALGAKLASQVRTRFRYVDREVACPEIV